MFKDKTLLVIAPHPDDEVLGCGGLISRVKADGGKVYVMIVTVGNQPQYGSVSKADIRIGETKETMEFLDVDDYEICWVDDKMHLKLDSIPQKDLIDLIENNSKVSLNKVKPNIVAVPHPNSNQDHRAVFDASYTACRPRPHEDKPFQRIVLVYEDASQAWSKNIFRPNFYVNLKEFLDSKCKALSFYKSQLHSFPHYISVEAVRNLASIRGIEAGLKHAEAFRIERLLIE